MHADGRPCRFIPILPRLISAWGACCCDKTSPRWLRRNCASLGTQGRPRCRQFPAGDGSAAAKPARRSCGRISAIRRLQTRPRRGSTSTWATCCVNKQRPRKLPRATFQAIRLQPDNALACTTPFACSRAVGCNRRKPCCGKPYTISHEVPMHYILGTVLWRQGQLDDAVVSYQLACARSPMTLMRISISVLAFISEQGRLDDAIAAYRTGLHHKPDAAYVHTNLVQKLYCIIPPATPERF